MRVSIVNTDDRGGAANAAIRLHRGLRSLDVNSTLIIYRGNPANDSTIRQARKPLTTSVTQAAMRLLLARSTGLDKSSRSRAIDACELFSDCRSGNGAALKLHPEQTDILNLHWVARFVDLPQLLPQFAGRIPIVWTLHDMQPLTGGCHYTAGCESFTGKCHSCPQLINRGVEDASAEVFEARLSALRHLRNNDLHIVSPSKWLLNEAARSTALSRFSMTCIPYGLDTTVFRPINKLDARKSLKLPLDNRLLLFVSASVQNHRKGLDLLVASLAKVKTQHPDLRLVAVGQKEEATDASLHRLGVITLGSIKDERLLAAAYSAADLFVIPSRQDNLPNTMLESIACGTPVVGFDVGGIPDVVRPNQTGWLARQLTRDSLAATISEALQAMLDRGLEAKYRANCRAVAETEYKLAKQAERYRSLFGELLNQRRTRLAA